MNVIRSGTLGFCMGVRRAVEIARQAAGTYQNGSGESQIYTLGPLIHNPAVLDELKERGVLCLSEEKIHDIPKNSMVIIRAHGISPKLERALTQHGVNVLDATCPHVKKNQEAARSFAERGYKVFLGGDKDHGEIAGIRSYVEEAVSSPAGVPSCFVVANPAEAEAAARELFRLDPAAKTVLLGQTTIISEEFQAIGLEIKKFFPNLEVLDTICGATEKRQKALRELCTKVQALIIAGGRSSANTRHLLAISQSSGKPAWLVESAADLPPEIKAYQTVGISAGASTPESLIDEIEEKLKSL